MYTMYCELIQIRLSPESHQLKLHGAIIITQTLQHNVNAKKSLTLTDTFMKSSIPQECWSE